MTGGWAHQLRREESRHSPAGLQVSWKSGTPEYLPYINSSGGNTEYKLRREQWVITVGRIGKGET